MQSGSTYVGANEIVGLIGDNGAGKSTLIKIANGVLKPTSGRLYIRDRLVDPEQYSVRRAHNLRIEAVHQEKSLADKQPLWRNLMMDITPLEWRPAVNGAVMLSWNTGWALTNFWGGRLIDARSGRPRCPRRAASAWHHRGTSCGPRGRTSG